MDGMLTQDEINALLNGMGTDEPASSDAASGDNSSAAGSEEALGAEGFTLTDMEKDAIGEIANISMGTSATTLYSLVNQKVDITTPVVTLSKWENVVEDYEKPCVFIQIKYTVGLDGANILVLKENDVKIITDLMMGGDGSNTEGELGELHLSAISEAMNQMMGSSSTSLSSMLGKKIDISPPEASLVDLIETKNAGDIAPFLEGVFVKISFRMRIGELVDSRIIQLYPIDFAKSLFDYFMANQAASGGAQEPEPKPAEQPEPQPVPQAAPQMNMAQPQMNMAQPQMNMAQPQMDMTQMNMGMMPQMNMGMMPQMNMGMMPQMNMAQPQMNIQPAQFQSFNTDFSAMASQENIGLIMDVPLEVTVELGRTKKSIAEILDFAPGTIIELEKIAGEPIDVLVNGKFVAKGEVVVIEESFGIRITEIIK